MKILEQLLAWSIAVAVLIWCMQSCQSHQLKLAELEHNSDCGANYP